jgi:hypothetical protein
MLVDCFVYWRPLIVIVFSLREKLYNIIGSDGRELLVENRTISI